MPLIFAELAEIKARRRRTGKKPIQGGATRSSANSAKTLRARITRPRSFVASSSAWFETTLSSLRLDSWPGDPRQGHGIFEMGSEIFSFCTFV
jgi:hypothetical protein